MTYTEAIEAIHLILKKELNLQTLQSFQEDARLNEDLALDSVMILQLLLQLEMDYGVDIPDEKIDRNTFYTVSTLATFLTKQQQREPAND